MRLPLEICRIAGWFSVYASVHSPWHQPAHEIYKYKQQSPSPDCSIHEGIEDWRVVSRQVLPVEDLHAFVKVYCSAHRTQSARGTMHVIDDCGWQVKNGPAGLLDAPAPVDVLAEHEYVLIEQADFVYRLTTHHHAGAGERIYFDRLVGVLESEVVFGESFVFGKQPAQISDTEESGFDGWKRAAAGQLQSAVGVEHFGTDRTALGMLCQVVGELADGTVFDLCVRVEQEHMLAQAFWNRLIASFRETQIVFVLNQAHVWKASLKHLHGIVAGVVVHDPDFKIVGLRLELNRLQASGKKVRSFPINDDDRYARLCHCVIIVRVLGLGLAG